MGDIAHGFFGRRGGVSTGLVAGLNTGLGSPDDPAAIAHNRALAADAVLPGAALVGLYQVHSADCVAASTPWGDNARPRADAVVTDQPGLLLAIVTADCAPVLLADTAAGVIGAAHAGWKGALAGVTDATIAAMITLGARREAIVAAIGPCIAQASYVVDEAFRRRFISASKDDARFFSTARAGHPHFALEDFVAARLASAGIAAVQRLSLDTYVDDTRFYSYRRATHRGESAYGRQISLIGLR